MNKRAEKLIEDLREFLKDKLESEEDNLIDLIMDYAITGVKLPQAINRKVWLLQNDPSEEFLDSFEKEIELIIGD